MTNHNSPSAIEARKNQADPLVMYLIVRKSLAMSAGKIAAQVGHAVGILSDQYHETHLPHIFESQNTEDLLAIKALEIKLGWYTAWKNSSYRKVVLVATENQWAQLKLIPEHVLVIDAGLTEVAPNSETVIGLWPMLKSAAPKVVQKCQVLK